MDSETPSLKGKPQRTVSRVLAPDDLVELVYSESDAQTKLVRFQHGRISITSSVTLASSEVLVPVPASNNLIKHRVVLLPENPVEYSSLPELIAEIRDYLYRYVDLSDEFLAITSYYILLTWVYDAFNELPYLRLRGDFGCGKTRALLVIGSICYKPFFASGASTVSPIFHTIDTFGGTFVFDEADFRFSDEKAELVKILNNGNVRGFPVLRTSVSAKREFDPVAFTVFGPKIVAMRDAFEDLALESRFLTEEMGQRAVRRDIPINLPDVQAEEAKALRNQLLLYRFQTLSTTTLDPTLGSPALSHRLNQIIVPLLSVIPDETARRYVAAAAKGLERSVVAERSALPEAKLLEVLATTLATSTHDRVPLSDVLRAFIEKYGADFERPITSRYVGALLRKRLHISPYKTHGTYVIAVSELDKVRVLCARFGIECPDRRSGGHGDVGTTHEITTTTASSAGLGRWIGL